MKKRMQVPARPPAPQEPGDSYPMRINKYLAFKGYSTRRGADEMVAKGQVMLGGKKAQLGDKVYESDTVVVSKKAQQRTYRYFAYNKPVGVVTHSAQHSDKDIKEVLKGVRELEGVFPIGRLDKDSHGLLILTDDGRITDRLLNPDSEHDKEYVVRTREKLRNSFKTNMERGVDIEGYVTKDCTVTILGDFTFSITLSEGKRHQIRRMVSALHNTVDELKRVRILNIKLGKLRSSEYRPLEGAELETFLKLIGLGK